MRTRFARSSVIAATFALVALVTGCTATEGPEAPEAAGDDGAFPVTIEGAYGDVTLKAAPETIVVSNSPDIVDMLDALDAPTPIVGSGWPEQQFADQFPWIDGMYDFADGVVTAEWEFAPEAVAAQAPDLIVAYDSTLSEELAQELSAVAPVYAVPYGADWRETLTTLGVLTGQNEQAESVIADMESAFAEARDRLPGLQGASFNGAFVNDGLFMTPSYNWIGDLGLKLAQNQPTDLDDMTTISYENLEQFAGDVVMILSGDEPDAELLADPRFAELPASQNGTVIWADYPLGSTMERISPRGLEYMLERIVPLLEESALNQAGSP